jgi:large exoprotein involved in heme utilization and adhesion
VVHGSHSGGLSAICSLSATAIAAALCIVSLNSLAGPAGGQVTAGSATITQTGSAGHTQTTINQSSNKAAIDWSKFSVGANESVRFNLFCSLRRF